MSGWQASSALPASVEGRKTLCLAETLPPHRHSLGIQVVELSRLLTTCLRRHHASPFLKRALVKNLNREATANEYREMDELYAKLRNLRDAYHLMRLRTDREYSARHVARVLKGVPRHPPRKADIEWPADWDPKDGFPSDPDATLLTSDIRLVGDLDRKLQDNAGVTLASRIEALGRQR